MRNRERKYNEKSRNSKKLKREILIAEQRIKRDRLGAISFATQMVLSAAQMARISSATMPNYPSGGIVIDESGYIDKEVFDKLTKKNIEDEK